MTTSTFPAALSDQLRKDPARPLVTFYDDASGERVELSVTTYANWVAKTASLVQDELDVERGALLLVDLPTHWLGAVWLGAAWSMGLCVATDPTATPDADLVVCGPDGVVEHAAGAEDHPVVALSLRPLGGRFVDPLPTGVIDYGAVVLAQPDAFTPYDPPTGDDPAWRDEAGTTSQDRLLEDTDRQPVVEPGGRLLTDVNPCSTGGTATLLSPLLHGGGAIWVAHPDEERWQQRYAEERATAELRAEGR